MCFVLFLTKTELNDDAGHQTTDHFNAVSCWFNRQGVGIIQIFQLLSDISIKNRSSTIFWVSDVKSRLTKLIFLSFRLITILSVNSCVLCTIHMLLQMFVEIEFFTWICPTIYLLHYRNKPYTFTTMSWSFRPSEPSSFGLRRTSSTLSTLSTSWWLWTGCFFWVLPC